MQGERHFQAIAWEPWATSVSPELWFLVQRISALHSGCGDACRRVLEREHPTPPEQVQQEGEENDGIVTDDRDERSLQASNRRSRYIVSPPWND